MPESMKAVVFDRFGEPGEVLRVEELPIPVPKRGEVRVRMIASPINPSDLLMIRGRYVMKPPLPATPGFEGVGIVDRAGPGLLGLMVKGRRVAVLNHQGGNWAEYAVIPARQARPISDRIPDDQAASLFVNPMTALALARHVLAVPKGEWLLQSAAGSNLGRMLIRLGKHDGFRTICVVRRKEAVGPLQAEGADVVICSADGPIDEQVRRIVAGGVKYAIDPVGGETGSQVFRSLGSGGRMVVFGSLTGEPLKIDNRTLIGDRQKLEGFWLGHWMRERSIPKALRLFREVGELIRLGVLRTDTGPSHPLTEITRAVADAEAPGSAGKALLAINPDWHQPKA
ncbi:MAG: zinc-dependent alcohol dehydrogenase family protein [Isosphaeraceae bacterium]